MTVLLFLLWGLFAGPGWMLWGAILIWGMDASPVAIGIWFFIWLITRDAS